MSEEPFSQPQNAGLMLSLQEINNILARLTALPHRGSGTAYEHQAAGFLRDYLTAQGHVVDAQTFRTPRTYSWELLGITLLLAIGGLYPAAWVALLGAYWFWAYFSGAGTPWDRWFDRHPSQNLVARVGQGPRKLLVTAHYDSAKTFFLYNPKRVRGFRLRFVLNAVLVPTVILAAVLVPIAARVVGLYFVAQALLLLHRETGAPYVNGANDNASGVAVAAALFLDLAAQGLPDTELWLVLTGAEEVGARGARAFLRANNLSHDTPVLNIDNVGRGTLHYATGEGMLGVVAFRGPLVEAAARLQGARPIVYRLAYFDTLPFARQEYSCLTLIRLDRGIPPNWHWPSDTREHVDEQALAETLAYARSLALKVLHPSEPPTR